MMGQPVDLGALLADPAAVAQVPPAELPALALRVAALQAAIAARLHGLVDNDHADDCECLDAEAVSHLLKCSVDLVRERGEEWGIAKVLARDSRGRPSRVVYPRAMIRAYLNGKPGASNEGERRRSAR